MPVKVEQNEGSIICRLSGEIDHHTSKQMREEIDRYAKSFRPALLVLDFRKVEFMDSSGIGLVLGRYRLMQELEGALKLINMPAHLRKVMHVAGIENLDIDINTADSLQAK